MHLSFARLSSTTQGQSFISIGAVNAPMQIPESTNILVYNVRKLI